MYKWYFAFFKLFWKMEAKLSNPNPFSSTGPWTSLFHTEHSFSLSSLMMVQLSRQEQGFQAFCGLGHTPQCGLVHLFTFDPEGLSNLDNRHTRVQGREMFSFCQSTFFLRQYFEYSRKPGIMCSIFCLKQSCIILLGHAALISSLWVSKSTFLFPTNIWIFSENRHRLLYLLSPSILYKLSGHTEALSSSYRQLFYF